MPGSLTEIVGQGEKNGTMASIRDQEIQSVESVRNTVRQNAVNSTTLIDNIGRKINVHK